MVKCIFFCWYLQKTSQSQGDICLQSAAVEEQPLVQASQQPAPVEEVSDDAVISQMAVRQMEEDLVILR